MMTSQTVQELWSWPTNKHTHSAKYSTTFDSIRCRCVCGKGKNSKFWRCWRR